MQGSYLQGSFQRSLQPIRRPVTQGLLIVPKEGVLACIESRQILQAVNGDKRSGGPDEVVIVSKPERADHHLHLELRVTSLLPCTSVKAKQVDRMPDGKGPDLSSE